MTSRKDLLSALNGRDLDGLIKCTNELSASTGLQECLTEISHRQLTEAWDNVQSMFVGALQDTDMDSKQMTGLLHCVIRLADATVRNEDASHIFIPPSLIEVAILVHGIFPTLTTEHNVLRDEISRLFERWWSAKAPGREELMGNTLLYLLDKSLGPRSTKADVGRLYSVCHVLDSIDLGHDNASVLVDLLLQTCVHHNFLESKQGIKFLAYLFTLNPELTGKLHQTVKNRLPATPSSWHTKFSEVYFRAWYEMKSPQLKEVLEQQCIQDLMYRAIHAHRGGQHSMAKILFRVLSFIHKKKTQKGVESMLVRLYEPVLWRALMVTNSDVRINAALLMFDMFPLQDPELNREQADAALQKQFDIMHNLLSDPVPEVRLTAVNGVGRVLNIYWELIPAEVIKCFVKKLVEDLAYDITSPTVREAVIKVMIQLYDNHLAVAMLQAILPQLRNFVHDSSEKVRVSMFDLLLKVKGLRAIKFWNLVPVEHILSRLQIDSAPIVRRIMKLLQPSFVPLHESGTEQVNRCLTLIGLNMSAARQFFLNLHHCISFTDIVKYITLLCRMLIVEARKLKENDEDELSTNTDDSIETCGKNSSMAQETESVKHSKSRKKIRKTGRDNMPAVDEGDSDGESFPKAGSDCIGDQGTFCGLVEAVYLMHTAIMEELGSRTNKDVKEGLAKKLSIMVREVMMVSQDYKLDEALIALSSHLPSQALPHIAQKLFSKLKHTSSVDERMDVKLIAKSLVLWGKAESVIQLVKESLESLFQSKTPASKPNVLTAGMRKSNQKKKNSVAFMVEERTMDPSLACSLIVNMITPAECRLILLTNHRESLLSLIDLMRSVEAGFDDHFSEAGVTLTQNDMKLYFDLYITLLRLTAFMCSYTDPDSSKDKQARDDSTQMIDRAVLWNCTSVVSHLNDEDKDRRNLSSAITESVVKICTNLMMTGLSCMPFLQAVARLYRIALESAGASMDLKSCVLRGVYQVVQICRYDKVAPEDGRAAILEDLVCFSIGCILKLLATIIKANENDNVDNSQEPDPQAVKCSSHTCQVVISKVVEIIQELKLTKVFAVVVEKLAELILEFMLAETEVPHQEDDSLPPMTTSLVVVFKKHDNMKRAFLQHLQHVLKMDNVKKVYQLKTILALLKVLSSDCCSSVPALIYQTLSNVLGRLSISDSSNKVLEELKKQVDEKISSMDIIETEL